MDDEFLTSYPGILDDRGLGNIQCLFDDVKLAEKIDALLGRCLLDPVIVLVVDVADMMQPVIDESMTRPLECSLHASAAVVPGDDDMLDHQYINRELQHGEAIQVTMGDDVGHVTVYEKLAGQETDDLVGWDSAIGAADPEILGRLLMSETGEEFGILFGAFGYPGAVVLEQVFEIAHSKAKNRFKKKKAAEIGGSIMRGSFFYGL